jgi:hypothetical protein
VPTRRLPRSEALRFQSAMQILQHGLVICEQGTRRGGKMDAHRVPLFWIYRLLSASHRPHAWVHNSRLFDKSVIGLPPNTAKTTAHYVVGARFCEAEPILEIP